MPIVLAKAKEKIPATDPIIRVAELLEGKIRAAYLKAVQAVKDQIALGKLAEAIRSGNVNDALAVLAIDQRFTDALQGRGLEASITSLKQAIQETFAAGAKAALLALPARASVSTSFDLLNPQAVNHLIQYDFKLIQGLTESVRETIQQTLLNGFREGVAPMSMAREIKDAIGLTPRMEKAVENYRAALESGTSAGLKDALSRSLRDGRFDPSLARALNQSTPLSAEKIDALVERYRARYLQYRARNIARTESIRASSNGQHELWRQARAKGQLQGMVRVWIASDDERTCAECQDLDGETADFDEEFEPGVFAPPDPHPDCRCSVGLVRDEEGIGKVYVILKEFDPNQPRDDHGRWTSDGGDDREAQDGVDRAFKVSDVKYRNAIRSKYDDAFVSQEDARSASRGHFISHEESEAITYYHGYGYKPMNGMLRGTPGFAASSGASLSQINAHVENLQNVIQESHLPEDMVLFRGGFLKAEIAASMKPGSVVSDKGFVSASMSINVAGKFATGPLLASGEQRERVIIRIEAPKGSNGLIHRTNSAEAEVILPHDSKFMVAAAKTYEFEGRPVKVVWMKYEGSETVAKEFDPNQPRDDHGRWTSEGGLDSEAAEAVALAYSRDDHYESRINAIHDQLNKKQDRLTSEEYDALEWYGESVGYQVINGQLRGRPISDIDRSQAIKTLQNAVVRSKLSEDLVLFRGSALRQETVAQLKPGAVVVDKGFTSTTLNLKIAGSFLTDKMGPERQEVLYRIEAPKGSSARIFNNPEQTEAEVVLPHGSRFEVQAVVETKGVGHRESVKVVWMKYRGHE